MTVTCSQCGEELMGAVNRCWRCGTTFNRPGAKSDLPPVRRAPVTLQRSHSAPETAGAITATVVDPESSASPQVVSTTVDSAEPRRGSPFASNWNASFQRWEHAGLRPESQAVGTWMSVLAVAMALCSLAVLFYVPVAAFFLAVFGLVLAAIGTHGGRRRVAIVGLILCLLMACWSGVRTAVQIYSHFLGPPAWRGEENEENATFQEPAPSSRR